MRKNVRFAILAGLAPFFAGGVTAQHVRMVMDINSTPTSLFSPGNGEGAGTCGPLFRSIEFDGKLFFLADTSTWRQNLGLWVTDGRSQEATLVRAFGDSFDMYGIGGFCAAGCFSDRFFFFAPDSTQPWGVGLWASDGTPQGTVLLKSLENTRVPLSTVSCADRFFFVAYDGTYGHELWSSDGSPGGTGLLRDIYPGPSGSAPDFLSAIGDLVFFSADDGQHGRELWITDGTPEGTSLVKDINSGSVDSLHYGTGNAFVAFENRIVFPAHDAEHRYEKWISDGSPEGTHALRELMAPSAGPIQEAQAFEGRVLFRGEDSQHGKELWITDGTREGTALVRDIRPGGLGSKPSHFVPFGDRILFSADDGLHGEELWITDGTPEGTALVKDIHPGPESTDFWHITPASGRFFFWTRLRLGGSAKFWVSDGATEGTVLVKDNRGPSFRWPDHVMAFAENIVFGSTYDGHSEVWLSDGTGDGTIVLNDTSYSCSSEDEIFVSPVREFGEQLFMLVGSWYCDANQIWTTDGTPEGTLPFGIAGTAGSSFQSQTQSFQEFLNRALYVLDDGEHGRELWVSDGTAAGTMLLKDISPGPLPGLYDHEGAVSPVGRLDGQLLFSASDCTHGAELWITDGTADGTRLVRDINQGSESGGPWGGVLLDGRLLFCANDGEHGQELWTTNGTIEGTHLVKDIAPGAGTSYVRFLGKLRDQVLLSAYDGVHGSELWITDGTSEGTHLLKDINPGPGGSHITFLPILRDQVLLSADDGVHRKELWITDGTSEGTHLLKDINPGPGGSDVRLFMALRDQVLLCANDGVHGEELWITDGTSEGTHLLKDINPGPGGSYITFLPILRDQLLLYADDGVHGKELWITDGTSEGTHLLKDINPGPGGSDVRLLMALRDQVLLCANDGVHGSELWATDGTTEGTTLVEDIRSGPFGSLPKRLTEFGGRMFFCANDGVHGSELWFTDGTTAGTSLVSDINLGAGGSSPADFRVVDRTLVFSAADPVHGRELWALSFDPIPSPFFTMTPEICQPGRTVSLDASGSTTPAETEIVNYTWDMGNGTVLEGLRIQYEYPEGTFGHQTICLTVTNDAGFSEMLCREFCIQTLFTRGDTNADSALDIADAVCVLSYLFGPAGNPCKEQVPSCLDAADANDDGAVDIGDAVYLLSFLFADGPDPAMPFGECGADPTEDELDCTQSEACQE